MRLALRTQQVIAYESGVADTVDPLGGPYAVEALTDEIEEGAEVYIAQIDALGGARGGDRAGFQQREIHDAAYRYQRERRGPGAAIVVGVNDSSRRRAAGRACSSRPGRGGRAARARGAGVRATRDAGRAERALDAARAPRAGATENLVPAHLDAVEAAVTLGEICGRLRAVFGVHQPSVTFEDGRALALLTSPSCSAPIPPRPPSADRMGRPSPDGRRLIKAFQPIDGLVVALEGEASTSTSARRRGPRSVRS